MQTDRTRPSFHKTGDARAARLRSHGLWMTFCLPLMFVAACAGVPKGVEPVSEFELERYLGTWYEIARLDHRFERGLSKITAHYGPRDGGGVTVLNRGFDAEAGEWKDAIGRAYFVEDESMGKLKVSFFGPFFGGYNIIALDKEGYAWAMVAGPDRSYLWILSRTPKLPETTLSVLVEKARSLDFPVDGLIYVDQEGVGG